MGDDVVLIENTSGNSFECLINDLDECFINWWDWYRPWKEDDVSWKRLIWISWYNIPIFAWNERFFATTILKFGAFVKMDEFSVNKSRLDKAKVLLSIPISCDVNIVITVQIDDKTFLV